MHFIWLDWFFILVIAASTLFAFFRGVVREAVSLVAWVLAIFLAIHLAPGIGQHALHFVGHPHVQYVIAFILVLLVVLIAGMIINFVLKRIITVTGLGFFDRLIGLIFGFLRGGLMVVALCMLMSMSTTGLSDVVAKSVIAQKLHPVVAWSLKHMPSKDQVRSYVS